MFSDSMMLGGGRKAAFSIAHSVRMDGVADYFTRTPSVKGNSKTFTISFWYKTGYDRYLFSCGTEFNNRTSISTNSYALQIHCTNGGSVVLNKISSAVFKDPTSWYHVAVKFDVGEVHAYVNGEEITSWYLNVNTLGNADTNVNNNCEHIIGENFVYKANGYGLNGYISDFTIVDGAALDASHFGETDPITGSWRPKNPDVTDYGTNGFHLDFADPANLGQDVSGNANHWTPVSLGAADVVADSPTNNFATWNQLDKGTGITFNGNLTLATTNELDAYYVGASLAFPTSKNWYWEIHIDSSAAESLGNGSSILLGVKTTDDSKVWSYSETYAGSGLYNYRGDKFSTEGQWESYTGDPFTTGDTISVLWNGTDRSLRFWKNGVDQGVAYSGLPQDALIPMAYVNNYTGDKITANFGQRPFAFNPPASFESLCTANLPTPVIKSPAKHFDVVTYTGNDTARSITGLDFQPDFVWIKNRDNDTHGHGLFDSVRGVNARLQSNHTGQESTSYSDLLTAFNADGFSLGADADTREVNKADSRYVAWCWKAGNMAIANTDGTIPSMVSVNQKAGFSIVSYSGTSNAGSVGHGLMSAPALVFIKPRSGVTDHWSVWHQALGSGNILYLDLTNAASAWGSGQYLMTAVPDSSTLHLGTNQGTNQSGSDYIAYCWAEVPGFSKFGSFTGNGSTDGPFVHCGFRPRWIMIKSMASGSSHDWCLFDTQRSAVNVITETLFANLSNQESTVIDRMDICANGFKIRQGAGNQPNINGETYIFAAFAEAPFGGKKTTPAKAR